MSEEQEKILEQPQKHRNQIISLITIPVVIILFFLSKLLIPYLNTSIEYVVPEIDVNIYNKIRLAFLISGGVVTLLSCIYNSLLNYNPENDYYGYYKFMATIRGIFSVLGFSLIHFAFYGYGIHYYILNCLNNFLDKSSDSLASITKIKDYQIDYTGLITKSNIVLLISLIILLLISRFIVTEKYSNLPVTLGLNFLAYVIAIGLSLVVPIVVVLFQMLGYIAIKFAVVIIFIVIVLGFLIFHLTPLILDAVDFCGLFKKR